MECGSPGSSAHRILQARTLEWVVIPFSRESSWPRSQQKGPREGTALLAPIATGRPLLCRHSGLIPSSWKTPVCGEGSAAARVWSWLGQDRLSGVGATRVPRSPLSGPRAGCAPALLSPWHPTSPLAHACSDLPLSREVCGSQSLVCLEHCLHHSQCF